MKTIDVKNISFRYRKKERPVLNDVSFSCEKGTVNVLIGLNGSGKTTLIKIIAGLLENYSGEVIVEDENLQSLSQSIRNKKEQPHRDCSFNKSLYHQIGRAHV